MNSINKPEGISRRDVLRLGLGLSASPFLSFNPIFKGNFFDLTNAFDNPGIMADVVEKRSIPVSGEQIPVIGMGTWRTFDAGNSLEKRKRLVQVLEKLNKGGGSVIDSSPMYGTSESVVGDLSGELKIRPQLFLATKVWTSGKEDGIRQMNESFRKMKTDTMNLMQVHNLVDVHTHIPTLKQWKEEWKIKYFGFTHYMPSVYPEMVQLIKSQKPDFVQFCYNIATRDAEKELLPLAKEKGIAVIINRPFEEGNLFNVVEGKPLPTWAREYEINSWAQFFLKFILSHPAVTCTIPATTKDIHMVENLFAGMGKLPDEKTREKMAEYFRNIQ